MELTVNGKDYPVECLRGRGRSSSVRIRDGRVVVRFGKYVWGKDRERVLTEFLKWAEKKLSEAKVDESLVPDYVDGGRIVTHNKSYLLEVRREGRERSRTVVDGDVILVLLPMEGGDVKDLVEKAIMKDQRAYLEEVVSEINHLHFQKQYGHVRFKRMQSRFGSCSAKRNLNFAYRLLFAPREVFRYVVVHELSHLEEFNQGANFWRLVEEAMPRYREAEKWLKKSGFMLG